MAPFVLNGFLLTGNVAFRILRSQSECYPLRLEKFQSENDELIQKRNYKTFFQELTIDKDSDESKISWKSFRYCRHSYYGREFIKS